MAKPRLLVLALALVLLSALGLAACGGADDAKDGDITVFAAASLTEAFTELAKTYEAEHDGAEVTFSFAASSDLASQINAGAPADVFASADEPNMAKVTAEGNNAKEPVAFAGNVLAIAVPKGNPGKVEGLDDFADQGLKLAVCAPEVPCGTAAQKLFKLDGVDAAIDSFEPDVKSVLTKVELGEVDAGLVYSSDVLAAGDRIDSVKIPDADRAVNTYPIVLVKDAPDPEGGQGFIDLVLSDRGQSELEKWGFRRP